MRVAALLVAMLASVGCRSVPAGPYNPPGALTRSTVEAERLNQRAADLIHEDPAAAEKLLREALTKDLFYGPAHNNLGIVFLGQRKLYEAANEFEWARKLLPGHPDPRVSLALTLETAGQNDEALRSYEAALEVAPEHLPAIQGAARLVLRSGASDERLDRWLRRISLSDDPVWSLWARDQLVRLGP